jgi:hypothetical protein
MSSAFFFTSASSVQPSHSGLSGFDIQFTCGAVHHIG